MFWKRVFEEKFVKELKLDIPESTKKKLIISFNAYKSFIKKQGDWVHHIAFLVDDIHKEINRLKKLNFNIINEKPVEGADNKIICFIHPKSTKKVLI